MSKSGALQKAGAASSEGRGGQEMTTAGERVSFLVGRVIPTPVQDRECVPHSQECAGCRFILAHILCCPLEQSKK